MIGYHIQAQGPTTVTMYRFEEAVNFLDDDNTGDYSPEELVRAGRGVKGAYIEPEALQKWADGVFRDADLATAIGAAIAAATEGDGYPQQVSPIKELLRQRLDQARAVMGIAEQQT